MPVSFKRCRPRFLGQNFDLYVQTANNLQVWNEHLAATRRYVLIRERDGVLTRVRVVTGEELAILDTTGTLTRKYQARLTVREGDIAVLITPQDTEHLQPLLAKRSPSKIHESPTAYPEKGKLMPVAELFYRLGKLIGRSFPDVGIVRE